MEQTSSLLPSIRPASDLRTKFTEVMAEIYQSDEPVFLTRKGRCDTVIMSADTFSKYELTRQALLDVREEVGAQLRKLNKASTTRCSFCNKKAQDAERVIAGPKEVYICDECVGLCTDILSEELKK